MMEWISTHVTEELLLQLFAAASFLGLLLYFPLKKHWSRVFDFMDVLKIYFGFGGAGLYIWFMFFYGSKPGVPEILGAVIIGGGFGLFGLITFFGCLLRCRNIFEMILMPFLMVSLLAAFFLVLAVVIISLFLAIHPSGLVWERYDPVEDTYYQVWKR